MSLTAFDDIAPGVFEAFGQSVTIDDAVAADKLDSVVWHFQKMSLDLTFSRTL